MSERLTLAAIVDLVRRIPRGSLFPHSVKPGTPGQMLFTGADSVVKWDVPGGATPTGPAGGDLTGTYPNPTFAVNMATQAELDAVAAAKAALAHSHPIGDVTDLQATLDAKSAIGHVHAWGDITGKPATFTPSLHAASHAIGGSDPIDKATAAVYGLSKLSVAPAVAGTPIAVGDNDPRMTDARTPLAHNQDFTTITGTITSAQHGNRTADGATTHHDWTQIGAKPSTFAPSAHTHPLSELTQSAATTNQVAQWNGTAWVPLLIGDANVLAANKDGAAGVASLRTIGPGALQAAAGNHAHAFSAITGAITAGQYGAGTIVNADISATAGIAKSKLAALNIVNADIDAAAAIAKSKLAALDIVNADIAAGAAITPAKLEVPAGSGTQFVKSVGGTNMWGTVGLSSLNDTDMSGGSSAGQVLAYDGVASKWKPSSPSAPGAHASTHSAGGTDALIGYALTTDLANYVALAGAQTITGAKTFSAALTAQAGGNTDVIYVKDTALANPVIGFNTNASIYSGPGSGLFDTRFILRHAAGVMGPSSGGSLCQPTVVSVLPSSPVDGQIIRFQNAAMATLGIEWMLVYRSGSASAYKWECIGGARYGVQQTESTTGISTTSLTYVNPSTALELTVPLAGDYEVYHEVSMACSVTGAVAWAAIARGSGATAVDTDAPLTTNATNFTSCATSDRFDALTAAMVLKEQIRVSAASTGSYRFRRLSIFPIRVG